MFGGYVLALTLDVDFSDAGHLSGTANLRLGDLRMCSLAGAHAVFNNLTVRQYLAAANQALGGGSSADTIDSMSQLTESLTDAFESGTPSTFAQQHLVNGPCSSAWQIGDFVTYDQDGWGSLGTTASNLLNNHFFTVLAVSGGFEIGRAAM